MSSINIIDAGLSFRNTMATRQSTTRIVIHHAAARACTVQQVHSWHLNNGWAGIGYHFFVRKDGAIYRGRPEHTVGCHASGGNYNSLGICFEGDYMAETTMPEAQKQAGRNLVAYLKQRYGVNTVQKHLQVSSTDCPGAYFPFEYIAGGSGSVNASSSAEGSTPAISADGTLRIDGWWGSATTTRLQQVFGTTVDGVVSNQWKCYENDNAGLDSGWEWHDKPNGQGSELIRAMQRWAGVQDADGEIGPDTIRHLQRKLGTTVDGFVSGPSEMVRALQRWANEQ